MRIFFMILFLLLFSSSFTQTENRTNIQFSESPAILDGEMEAIWDSFEANQLVYMIDGDVYPDSLDCSGYLKAFLYQDSMFLLIVAMDDSINTSSSDPWENDGFEVYFDMDNSKDSEFKNDNYQFRFVVNSSEITGRHGLNTWTPPTVKFAIKTYMEGYRILETAFPLLDLGLTNPIEGLYMGFDAQILDNDGEGRECAMAWNNNEHHAWEDPSKMGTIYFGTEPASIVNSETQNSIQIFPNPATTLIHLSSETKMQSVTIIDLAGLTQLKLENINENNISVDITNLNTGMYSIAFKTAAGHIKKKILVKD